MLVVLGEVDPTLFIKYIFVNQLHFVGANRGKLGRTREIWESVNLENTTFSCYKKNLARGGISQIFGGKDLASTKICFFLPMRVRLPEKFHWQLLNC